MTIGAVTAAALGGFALPAAAGQAGTTHGVVRLTGAEEAPGPGDADGRGIFVYRIRGDRLCYVLTARRIEPSTMAHIHRAPRGVPGPIVIGLIAPTDGVSVGCVTAVDDARQTPENAVMTLTHSELRAIRDDPAAHYTNVHNVPFPAGAIRGQLA